MAFGWAGPAKVAVIVFGIVGVVLSATAEPDGAPQVIVTARKADGGFARPGSIWLKPVKAGGADEAAVDVTRLSPEELQKVMATRYPQPIVPKVDERVSDEAVFSGLAPGRYSAYWIDGSEGLIPVDGPIEFDLKAGDAPIRLALKVTEGGTITGRVTDVATHGPLAEVDVRAATSEGAKPSSGNARTDADGRYRIAGLGKGTYIVEPSAKGGFRPIPGADQLPAVVVPGKTVEGVDLSMRDTPRIRGRVLDAAGQPAAGVTVTGGAPFKRGNTSGSVIQDAETGADGNFELKGFDPTDNLTVAVKKFPDGTGLCAPSLGPLVLTEAGLDGLVLQAQNAAEISGVVVDSAGKPVSEAMINLQTKNYEHRGGSVTTDGSGAFSIKGVLAGDYVLSAFVPRRNNGGVLDLRSDAVRCTVKPGEKVTGLKLTVPTNTLSIAGTVRDAAGKPIEGVKLMPSKGRPYCGVGAPDEVATDKEGRYLIPGLPAGNYWIGVGDESKRYRSASRESVAAGSADVDFTLHEARYVEGRVVAAETGQPISEFGISLVPRRYEEPLDGNGGGQLLKDAEGRFKLLMDFEGTTDITLVAYGPGYAAEKTFVSAVSPDKALTDVVVKLHRAGIVRGTVFDPDGKPKPEVKILRGEYTVVHDWDLYRLAAESGRDGTFEAKDLTPGPQKLTAYCPGFAPVRIDVAPESGGTQAVKVSLSSGAVLEGDLSIGGKPVDKETFVSLRVDYTAEIKPRSNDFADHGKSHYSFEHPVAPGRAWVTADFNQKNNSVGVVRREVTLKDGVPAKVDLDLPVGKCSIEGSVAAPEGVKNFRLEFDLPLTEGKAVIPRWGQPGAFRFEDLPEGAGEVSIRAWLPDRSELVRKVPVKLVAGTPCRLDVDLR